MAVFEKVIPRAERTEKLGRHTGEAKTAIGSELVLKLFRACVPTPEESPNSSISSQPGVVAVSNLVN